jgi:hypothetical protein
VDDFKLGCQEIHPVRLSREASPRAASGLPRGESRRGTLKDFCRPPEVSRMAGGGKTGMERIFGEAANRGIGNRRDLIVGDHATQACRFPPVL